ncbi:MAG: hypothetical protein LQ346_004324 [Caloplaca aetnensis]|nr:MAG: hypothetical protein LQ346_004324 [Caloplaca aetnensis]
MHDLIPLVLRALQLLFAIILLGMAGWLVSITSGSYLGYNYNSPSPISFMLFTTIWTIFPALTYLVLAPRFLPLSANNKIIHLAMDAITALFWFAGFIALAAWYGDHDYCLGSFCGVVVATCVFGAFEWLLFTATTVLSALDWNRTRGNSSAAKTAPETTVV